MTKLREEDVMAADVMERRGRSIRSVAGDFDVDESTLRYRLGRLRSSAEDGRRRQREACAVHQNVIVSWLAAQEERIEAVQRPAPLIALYEELAAEHGYAGSYKAVVRYVRRRKSAPRICPSRRLERWPGAQAQVDWVQTQRWVDALGGLLKVWAFLMVPSQGYGVVDRLP